jgi:hypothetical protein
MEQSGCFILVQLGGLGQRIRHQIQFLAAVQLLALRVENLLTYAH